MLLFLPLLVLPFLALGFYALGGGRDNTTLQSAATSRGIDMQLPGAQLQKDGGETKMAVYNRAEQDSITDRSKSAAGAFAALGWDTAGQHRTNRQPGNTIAANEAKITERLAEINRQISRPEPVSKPLVAVSTPDVESAKLQRLEQLLQQKQQDTATDPQLRQLNVLLDKIQQIQHPGLVEEKQKKEANPASDSAFEAIPAIIDGNQKVAPGGVVKLRLQDSIHIHGLTIPKGQLLFGSCTVTNQRLLLDIRDIRLGTAIIPVSLTVFSMDGMPGIAAPEAELGEAAGNGANGALENMQFLGMDGNLSTQAATAGISAAKDLLGKKVKKIRVKLKGGQPVLLRINH